VTLSGSPPNCLMFCWTQRRAITWSFRPLLPEVSASSVLKKPWSIQRISWIILLTWYQSGESFSAYLLHLTRKEKYTTSFPRICGFAWSMIRTTSSPMYFAYWFSILTYKMSFFAIENSRGRVGLSSRQAGPWICVTTATSRKLVGGLFGYPAYFCGVARAPSGDMFQNVQKIHLV
jgi:hypothetical protein